MMQTGKLILGGRLLAAVLFLWPAPDAAGRQDSGGPGYRTAGSLPPAHGTVSRSGDTLPQEPPAASLSIDTLPEEPLPDSLAVDTLAGSAEEVRADRTTGSGNELDSLLNLWYVREPLDTSTHLYDPLADTLAPEFPDSVYISRLSEVPSVVDLAYNPIVRNYIHVYTRKRREQVRNMLSLSRFYFPQFEAIFDLYGVPYELKYLSVIESALNPRAVSRAGAVGIWQFMYSTGRHYGLTINSLVDERRDPMAATHAAARFLVDLYGMYGDWTLALAAYNCGPGNVNKAIRRTGGKRNFWEIYYFLPRETRGYVPAFVAATYVMNFHHEHLISPAPPVLPLYTDTLMVREPVHLEQIAGVLGIPVGELRDLNPQYRADVVPANTRRPYAIRLPVDRVASFIDLEDSVYAYRDSVYFDPDKQVAAPRSYTASRVDMPADKYDRLIYTVQPGDNVGYIADWYDVRASDLRYWNGIRRNLIRSGQKLVIYKPKGQSDRYRAVSGMSFAEKQRFAGRAVSASGSSGPSDTAGAGNDRPGGNDGSAGTGGNDGSAGTGGRSPDDYVTYTVRSGDTLWEIARKYSGVNENDIARLNNLTQASRIRPGQVLLIRPKD